MTQEPLLLPRFRPIDEADRIGNRQAAQMIANRIWNDLGARCGNREVPESAATMSERRLLDWAHRTEQAAKREASQDRDAEGSEPPTTEELTELLLTALRAETQQRAAFALGWMRLRGIWDRQPSAESIRIYQTGEWVARHLLPHMSPVSTVSASERPPCVVCGTATHGDRYCSDECQQLVARHRTTDGV